MCLLKTRVKFGETGNYAGKSDAKRAGFIRLFVPIVSGRFFCNLERAQFEPPLGMVNERPPALGIFWGEFRYYLNTPHG